MMTFLPLACPPPTCCLGQQEPLIHHDRIIIFSCLTLSWDRNLLLHPSLISTILLLQIIETTTRGTALEYGMVSPARTSRTRTRFSLTKKTTAYHEGLASCCCSTRSPPCPAPKSISNNLIGKTTGVRSFRIS